MMEEKEFKIVETPKEAKAEVKEVAEPKEVEYETVTAVDPNGRYRRMLKEK